MKVKKDKDLTTEAALKKACKVLEREEGYIHRDGLIISIISYATEKAVATFDIRDFYRKRSPIKGATKAMRKMLRGKRK